MDSCRYGPDGKVQKTPVVQPPPAEKKRGLKGKIVAKKTGEMKEELEATVALIQQYVPPAPGHDPGRHERRHGVARARPGPNWSRSTFPGYAKQGDALTVTFDKAITGLRQIDVKTWLEKPEEPATLQVAMQSLPNGDQLPGQHRAEHPGEQDRSADHEVELPEAGDVGAAASMAARRGRVPMRCHLAGRRLVLAAIACGGLLLGAMRHVRPLRRRTCSCGATCP